MIGQLLAWAPRRMMLLPPTPACPCWASRHSWWRLLTRCLQVHRLCPKWTHNAGGLSTYLAGRCRVWNSKIRHAAGVLRCIAWAVEEKTDGQPARCASYMLTLAWDERNGAATACSVQLLRRSKLPPHAVCSSLCWGWACLSWWALARCLIWCSVLVGLQVVVCPEEDAVALALDPSGAQGSAAHNTPGLGAGDHQSSLCSRHCAICTQRNMGTVMLRVLGARAS